MTKSQVIVLSDHFGTIIDNLIRNGRELEREGAEYFYDRVQEQLYPGHGYRTGYMANNIRVEDGNTVQAHAEYTIFVNDGTASFPGYHFWDQAEIQTREWLRMKAVERIGSGLL